MREKKRVYVIEEERERERERERRKKTRKRERFTAYFTSRPPTRCVQSDKQSLNDRSRRRGGGGGRAGGCTNMPLRSRSYVSKHNLSRSEGDPSHNTLRQHINSCA